MDEKFASPVKLNVRFDYSDLHELLKESLPEEIWILRMLQTQQWLQIV